MNTNCRFCRCLVLWGILLLSTKPAWCASDVYVDLVEPLAFRADGAQHGLLFDLMTEMGRRAHHVGPVTPLPLMRQRVLLKHRADAIGTLWRFDEIEHDYRWWCKLFDSNFVMVAAKASTVDISTVQAAKDLRIGVILGSPAELLAHQIGFLHIETAFNAESNARKLLLGRIDIWIAAPSVVRATQARLGRPLAAFRISETIGRHGLYVASSKNFAPDEAASWIAAFESMQRDGSYAQITKRYGVVDGTLK